MIVTINDEKKYLEHHGKMSIGPLDNIELIVGTWLVHNECVSFVGAGKTNDIVIHDLFVQLREFLFEECNGHI